MAENEEFIAEFLIEAVENLDQLDQDLVALENNPSNPERLASIFRTVHTIKGTCGFFGFTKLGSLTHHGEHLLGLLRDGGLSFDDQLASLLLEMTDAIRVILGSIESTREEGSDDFADLCHRLDAAVAGASTIAQAEDRDPSNPSSSTDQQDLQTQPPAGAAAPTPAAQSSDGQATDAALPPQVGESQADETSASNQPAELPAAAEPSKPKASPPLETPLPRPSVAAESTIRVDISLLDTIVDLVGELVLARNQLRSTAEDNPALTSAVNRIHTVTGELQEAAMQTRMASIDQLFSKFPRIVRDVSATCGKQVELSVDGADTELDRTLIEKIRDPLTHLIRNAIDHGIEQSSDRLAAGKPAAGQLSLRAFHESGQVTIEVADDGGGISVDMIRSKAIARGLVTAAQAEPMSAERILQFIFEPGFSTAETVSSISGRGVGMDVVRTNIESIGGTVDISSNPGEGTVVRVRIPLTLAIIPALIVTAGGERLAIPQPYVQELVALRNTKGGNRIEGLENAPILRLRDRLIPVVYLDRWLGLRTWESRPTTGTVVIVQVDDHEFGLVVDAVTTANQQQTATSESVGLWFIVVKPIGSLLSPLGIYSGATVMGDGGVVLILDLRGIALATDIPSRLHHRAESMAQTEEESIAFSTQNAARYLACETYSSRRIAVQLTDVVRLETFPHGDISHTGSQYYVKRDGYLLPLLDPDQMSGTTSLQESLKASQSLVAVIVTTPTGSVALAVKRILDVDAAESDQVEHSTQSGLLGTLLVGGVATDVIDVSATFDKNPSLHAS
jgi:two-component system chemotaxis sensor kinase CheA